jgi:CMP-N-acetylneuraminic acid synthetase
VLVSSDDEEIRAVAERYDGVKVDARAAELGGDRIKVVEVIAEICQRPAVRENFDVIAMMLPTAPFRRLADIQAGHAALSEDVDGVISLAPYDFPPQMAVTLAAEDGIMAPLFDDSPLLTGNTRSQDQAAAYRPNGSYYMSWVESFLRRRSFFTDRVRGIVMTRLGSVDIDEAEDLALARLIAEGGLAPSDTL